VAIFGFRDGNEDGENSTVAAVRLPERKLDWFRVRNRSFWNERVLPFSSGQVLRGAPTSEVQATLGRALPRLLQLPKQELTVEGFGDAIAFRRIDKLVPIDQTAAFLEEVLVAAKAFD
jgi:hypothetical protein